MLYTMHAIERVKQCCMIMLAVYKCTHRSKTKKPWYNKSSIFAKARKKGREREDYISLEDYKHHASEARK